MDVEGSVIEVLKSVSRRPIAPTPTSDLIADLGLDSLQLLEVVSELEDRFDIAMPTATASTGPTARTVAEVVAQVAALVEGRPGA